jgi:hypothetical protein
MSETLDATALSRFPLKRRKEWTMALDVYQFGGYTGSYAGDCCVIGSGSSFVMIDLGMNKKRQSTCVAGTQATRAMQVVENATDLDVIVTHFHKDHTNGGKSWPALKKLNACVHYGPAIAEPGISASTAMTDVLGNRAKKYDHSQNGTMAVEKNFGEWKLQVYLITPDIAYAPAAEENYASLGVLIELYKGEDNPVNILSLGDMTLETGDAAVRAVLSERGFGKGSRVIRSVKLSHHGSENNLLPVLDDVVSDACTVLISGYTLTAVTGLLAKLRRWQPKRTCMLFDERGKQEIAGQLDSGTVGGKALIAANVEILTDFHVALN